MSTNPTERTNKPPTPAKHQDRVSGSARKTYFGVMALITGILADLFIGANLAVAYMEITPSTFNQWNNLTALFYCILTPLAGALGIAGHVRKNDSKILSWMAIVLVTIPFAIIFARLVSSQLRQ